MKKATGLIFIFGTIIFIIGMLINDIGITKILMIIGITSSISALLVYQFYLIFDDSKSIPNSQKVKELRKNKHEN